MKKLGLIVLLTTGLVLVSGRTAHTCDQADSFEKKHSKVRIMKPRRDLLNLQTIAAICKSMIITRCVNFSVLGGTLGGHDLKTFTHLTKPGEGLVLEYAMKGCNSPWTSVILSTDKKLVLDGISPDSQYPAWNAIGKLSDGLYTAKLYIAPFEKAGPKNAFPLLITEFTVSPHKTCVKIDPATSQKN
ncbi:hypothetical protein [Candidatus Finniella inopinata]|uniref:Uncharacterized protein n=1 Tax=Candidatus Finniella inopinata TaxID=1696036 RepID=A0A4Q7DPS4_9PROT|nr:hypothetical protein [Candidatus Finniella inopinata]RZI47026.1 hypothetical protein EQU50_00100 [Candidatus Finniella inopinata]